MIDALGLRIDAGKEFQGILIRRICLIYIFLQCSEYIERMKMSVFETTGPFT